VAEERRHGGISAQRRAVDLHELAADLSTRLLELIDPARELRLARPGRAAEEDRIAGRDGHLFDAFDEAVVGRILGFDTRLQEREAFRALLLKASRNAVVSRQIEVDDRVRAGRVPFGRRRRRRLNEAAGDVARLDEEE